MSIPISQFIPPSPKVGILKPTLQMRKLRPRDINNNTHFLTLSSQAQGQLIQ